MDHDHAPGAGAESARLAPAAITALRVRAVKAPMLPPLQTASGTIDSAPLVLIDLDTDASVTGRSYVFCYSAQVLAAVRDLAAGLASSLTDRPLTPLALWTELRAHFRLLGPVGLIGLALGGLDMAIWDALARHAGVSLGTLLGGDESNRVAAYGSLRSARPADVVREAEEMLATGVHALKLKVGLGGLDDDLAVVGAVREVAGDAVALMVDYNQSLPLREALRRCQRLDEEGLAWIEEPVDAFDVGAMARVAQELDTPVQAGESWWSPIEAARSIEAGGSDLVMLDVARIGGVSGWREAAPLAEAAGLPISSHIYPEFSAHLLAATRGRHLLEWLDVAGPILETPAKLDAGAVRPRGPGAGLSWDEEAVQRYLYREP
jgi:mandelate racemase